MHNDIHTCICFTWFACQQLLCRALPGLARKQGRKQVVPAYCLAANPHILQAAAQPDHWNAMFRYCKPAHYHQLALRKMAKTRASRAAASKALPLTPAAPPAAGHQQRALTPPTLCLGTSREHVPSRNDHQLASSVQCQELQADSQLSKRDGSVRPKQLAAEADGHGVDQGDKPELLQACNSPTGIFHISALVQQDSCWCLLRTSPYMQRDHVVDRHHQALLITPCHLQSFHALLRKQLTDAVNQEAYHGHTVLHCAHA